MKRLIDSLASRKTQISKEEYDAWRDSAVTRRFYHDKELEMIETAIPKAHGTLEQCGMSAARATAKYDCLEELLNWKPEELLHE